MKDETTPEPVVLIIADISGYTQYMTANAKTLAHSQALITELVKAILFEVELPLKVAKLEGDAVFLFARKNTDLAAWSQSRKLIGWKILRLFERFSAKVTELSSATTCTCNACSHIQNLRLKVVVHSGEALFHQVLAFEELAGVDVIIVHRLLKNSIKADQYLLLTAAAQQDLEWPGELKLARTREKCEGIGEIEVGVHYPESNSPILQQEPARPFSQRFTKSWDLLLKLWFRPFQARERQREFHHVVASGNRIGRTTYALLTAILTPVFLPVGAFFVLAHAMRTPHTLRSMAQDNHAHTADGSCCEAERIKHD
jgi:hypothetical protein